MSDERKFQAVSEAMSVRFVAHVLNWKAEGKPLAELVNTEIAREIEGALIAATEATGLRDLLEEARDSLATGPCEAEVHRSGILPRIDAALE